METKDTPAGDAELTQQHPEQAPSRSSARPAEPAAGGRDGASWGAPPSNTAPHNCNGGGFKPLRWGVDSLYLSYQGELGQGVLTRLKALKELAQGQDAQKQSLAQYPINGHIFEVKDKGAPLFPYVLEDGAFRIQLSKGGRVPMAYVKVSSTFLAHVGPAKAERELAEILGQFGVVESVVNVSRIDLFVDFVWTDSVEWNREAWITRATSIDTYSESGIFTGWVVGKGGAMMARLYLKSLQAAKLGIDYLRGLWKQAGRDDEDPVWRLEFQIKREVLAQMKIARLGDTLRHLNGLWCYATDDWLRLAIPNAEDGTRSRWPIHPLWGYLASIDWETDGGALLREFSPSRVPEDKRLYSLNMASLTSYMAKHGFRDLYQGYEAFTAAMVQYYSDKASWEGLSFDDYVADRVALKARQFNTSINDPDGLAKLDEEAIQRGALAYRKASKGG